MSPDSCSSKTIDPRFGGTVRLYGESGYRKLLASHVTVVGLGGVGSWAAEALARIGVGELSLIDLDELCVTNINRQVHALGSTVGCSKASVLAMRIKDINPAISLNVHEDFLTQKNIASLIAPSCGYIIDAIDSAAVKAALIAYILREGKQSCKQTRRRLVTVGSSGGKVDASMIEAGDLGASQHDPLLSKVRSILYRYHGFKRPSSSSKGSTRKFRIDAITSAEARRFPTPEGEISRIKQKALEGTKLDCSSGLGSSVIVTASFGLRAAQQVAHRIIND